MAGIIKFTLFLHVTPCSVVERNLSPPASGLRIWRKGRSTVTRLSVPTASNVRMTE
jgi:hypothetical protein